MIYRFDSLFFLFFQEGFFDKYLLYFLIFDKIMSLFVWNNFIFGGFFIVNNRFFIVYNRFLMISVRFFNDYGFIFAELFLFIDRRLVILYDI
jgi:hypothetical protein